MEVLGLDLFNMKWGGMFPNVYFLIARVLCQRMSPWEMCIDISEGPSKMIPVGEEHLNVRLK